MHKQSEVSHHTDMPEPKDLNTVISQRRQGRKEKRYKVSFREVKM
jgi:hypothetical protein